MDGLNFTSALLGVTFTIMGFLLSFSSMVEKVPEYSIIGASLLAVGFIFILIS